MNKHPTTLQKLSRLAAHRNMAGLSLIELMIAMTVSMLLLIGVTSIYLNSRETDKFTNELSRIQETGRIAMDFLAHTIRMVGYQGCLDPNTVEMNIIANNPPTGDFFNSALIGFEVTDANWAQNNVVDPVTGDVIQNNGEYFIGQDFVANALIGSDVIAVQSARPADIELTGNMSASNANIQVSNNEIGFEPDDIVLISDCQNGDLFRISSNPDSLTWAHANNVNTDNRLSAPYDLTAQILRFESVVYFVADTGRTNIRGEPINALYRAFDNMDNTANPQFTTEELIEGIDNMQFLYGERLASGNLRYVTADNVGNMELVESIQVGLLVSGTANVLSEPEDTFFILPGEVIQPESEAGADVTYASDRSLRREFTQTVQLRNR